MTSAPEKIEELTTLVRQLSNENKEMLKSDVAEINALIETDRHRIDLLVNDNREIHSEIKALMARTSVAPRSQRKVEVERGADPSRFGGAIPGHTIGDR